MREEYVKDRELTGETTKIDTEIRIAKRRRRQLFVSNRDVRWEKNDVSIMLKHQTLGF